MFCCRQDLRGKGKTMRISILAFSFLLSMSAMGYGASQSPASIEASHPEVIEEIEVVEPAGDQQRPFKTIISFARRSLLKISGPIIWLCLASAIITRHARIKGKARQLSMIHRICGYTAFGLGTIHGLYGLFF